MGKEGGGEGGRGGKEGWGKGGMGGRREGGGKEGEGGMATGNPFCVCYMNRHLNIYSSEHVCIKMTI